MQKMANEAFQERIFFLIHATDLESYPFLFLLKKTYSRRHIASMVLQIINVQII